MSSRTCRMLSRPPERPKFFASSARSKIADWTSRRLMLSTKWRTTSSFRFTSSVALLIHRSGSKTETKLQHLLAMSDTLWLGPDFLHPLFWTLHYFSNHAYPSRVLQV